MARETNDAVATTVNRLDVRPGQTLIAIPWIDGDEEVVSYFNDEAAARAFTGKQPGESAMSVLGAWSDLDWDEFVEAIDRIRHQSKPTPPIDDLGL